MSAVARQGHVHLWMRGIGASGDPLEDSRGKITAAEAERADKFRFEQHRNRFIRGRAFLREILASFCGCAAHELPLSTGEDGKPLVQGSPVAFNLSHSGDVAVLGIAPMREIGVDVECFDRRVECVALARRYFADSEINALEMLEPAAQRELFFRLWTSKEAAMKATGEGLRIDPRGVEVLLDSNVRPMRYDGRFAPWYLANEDIHATGVTVSVAAPEPFSLVWEKAETAQSKLS